jgi:hypothetical protein
MRLIGGASAAAFDEQQGDDIVELPSDVALQLGPHVSNPASRSAATSANSAAAELRFGWSVRATRATVNR